MAHCLTLYGPASGTKRAPSVGRLLGSFLPLCLGLSTLPVRVCRPHTLVVLIVPNAVLGIQTKMS